MKNRLKILFNYNLYSIYTMLKYIFVFLGSQERHFSPYIDYINGIKYKERFYALWQNEYSIEKMKTFKVSTWKYMSIFYCSGEIRNCL